MGNAGEIRAGKAFIELYADKTALIRDINGIKEQLRPIGDAMASAGTAISVATAAIAAGLGASTKYFSEAAAGAAKMSQRTGLGVEALSELAYVAKTSGTSIEELEGGIRKMNKYISEAATSGGEARDTFEALGVSIEDLAKQSPEDRLNTIADAIASVKDASQRAEVAMRLFGKTGTTLIPLLSGGASGLAEGRQTARDLGLSISKEDASTAERLNDTLDTLEAVVKRTSYEIGAALAPSAIALAEVFTKATVATNSFISTNRDLVVDIAEAVAVVGALGGALLGLSTVIRTVSATLTAIQVIVKALEVSSLAINLTIGTGVVGALAAAAVAAGSLIYAFREVRSEMDKTSLAAKDLASAIDDAVLARARLNRAQLEGNGEEATKQATRLMADLERVYNELSDRNARGMEKFPSDEGQKLRQLSQRDATNIWRSLQLEGDPNQMLSWFRGEPVILLDDMLENIKKKLVEVRKLAQSAPSKPAKPALIDLSGLKRQLDEEAELLKARSIEDPLAQALALNKIQYDKMRQTPGLTDDRRKQIDANQAQAEANIRLGFERQLADEIAGLRIAAIENEQSREIASVTDHYGKLIEARRRYGGEVSQLEQAQQLAVDNIRKKYQRDYEDRLRQVVVAGIQNPFSREAAGISDEFQKAVANATTLKQVITAAAIAAQQFRNLADQRETALNSTRDEIDRLKSQLDNRLAPQRQRDLAALDVEERIARRDAARNGIPTDLIQQLFSLRRQLVDLPSIETRGALSSFALQSLQGAGGSAADRTAKAAEETVKLTQKVVSNTAKLAQTGSLTFTP